MPFNYLLIVVGFMLRSICTAESGFLENVNWSVPWSWRNLTNLNFKIQDGYATRQHLKAIVTYCLLACLSYLYLIKLVLSNLWICCYGVCMYKIPHQLILLTMAKLARTGNTNGLGRATPTSWFFDLFYWNMVNSGVTSLPALTSDFWGKWNTTFALMSSLVKDSIAAGL